MDEGKALSGRRTGELLAGRYRLGRILGEGGFGLVYEGVDETTGEPVAVKLLHAHLVDVTEVVKRFRREAAMIRELSHPNVVAVRDTGTTDDGVMFLVMERLRGQELSARLAEVGPLTVAEAVRIARAACEGLYAVHQRGVVHRDLKPDNLFLARSDEGGGEPVVKLLDFGVSKMTATGPGEASLATQTGATLGTPYYMAPEQAQGKKTVDARADVYALGVILFRMLTGQHPFEDTSYPMLVVKICTEPPPSVTLYRGDVPAALDAVIARMLAKDPAARFADCAAVHEALAPFAHIDVEPQLLEGPRTSEASARALAERLDSPLAHAPTLSPVDLARADAPFDDDETPPPRTRTVWPFVIAAALALCVAAAYVFSRPEPAPTASGAPLPRAKPATHALLRTSRDTSIGWRWLNPLPRAMPTWNDVDVGGTNMVAMVGRAGAAAYYIGDSLFPVPTGTTATLNAVCWYGPTQTLAAGDDGTLRLITREGPHAIDTHTRAVLHGVASRSTTEAVAVGEGGTLLRISGGTTATSIDTGTDDDLLAVHVRGSEAWIAGESGTLLRWNGQRIEWEQTGVRTTLRAVGGCAEGDLYVAGDDGLVLRRTGDGRYARLPSTGREPWSDIACVDGLVALSGMRGGVLLVSGTRAVRLPSDDARPFFGVGAADGANAWAVGAGGKLVAIARDHLVVLIAGTTKSLYGFASFAGVPVVVGIDGQILRLVDGRFQDSTPHATDAGLAAVVPIAEDQLVAVGDAGAIVTIDLAGTARAVSPTEASLRDVVAADHTLLAVGAGGTIVRGPIGALVARSVPDVGTLYGVAGSPTDAHVVGEAGAVLRVDGVGERRIPCDERVTLRSVMRHGDGALAVGEGGVVLRITDAGCVVERPFEARTRDLFAVGPGPAGRPIAVGAAGLALERGDDGTWAPYTLEAAGYDLHRIVATDRDVYVVGAGGVVLRHPRIERAP